MTSTAMFSQLVPSFSSRPHVHVKSASLPSLLLQEPLIPLRPKMMPMDNPIKANKKMRIAGMNIFIKFTRLLFEEWGEGRTGFFCKSIVGFNNHKNS